MTYSYFVYSNPVVKATADGFEASVTVTNRGKVAGKEVVEVFVHAPEGGLEKPDQERSSRPSPKRGSSPRMRARPWPVHDVLAPVAE